MIDRASGVPAYRQVARELRAQIIGGVLSPGDKLPSERQLADTYGISRPTIRHAVSLLRAEDLVTAEHGKGVFIRTPHRVRRLNRTQHLSRATRTEDKGAFLTDAATGGFTPDVSVKIRVQPAAADIARVLGLEAGAEITVRERVMRADGLVIQLATSRLPREFTRGTLIEKTNTGPGGTYARLEEAGHRLGHFEETVGTRMPTPAEISMQLPPDSPILCVRRIAYADSGTPLEVNDMRLAGNRYELTYELPAD